MSSAVLRCCLLWRHLRSASGTRGSFKDCPSRRKRATPARKPKMCSTALLRYRKDLFERHFPLTQPQADDRDVSSRIDAHDSARLVEALNSHGVARLQTRASLAQSRLLGRLALGFHQFLLVFLALPVGLVLSQQRLRAGLLGLLAQLLEASHFRRAALSPTQITTGALQQLPRQLQAAGDLEGVAHAELADMQAIGRPQRLDVELDG